jgi:hypothetical protein
MADELPEENLVPITIEKGVNNIDKENDVGEGFAREAVNIDITRTGWPRRRKGYTRLKNLTDGHSLYSNGINHLVADSGQLNLLDFESLTLDPIAPALDRVSYADVIGTIYCTDGTNFGRVMPDGTYRDAWIKNPSGWPTVATSSTGSLVAGKYMVAITYVDAYGEESGTDISVPIELTVGGGIDISEIPQDSSAAYTRIYLTARDGEVFYRQLDLPMGLTSYALKSFTIGKELETQFAEPMPAGNLLCYHYGRLYTVTDDYIRWSEALRPGLTRIMDNYFPRFGGTPVIIMSHKTGLFVVADNTYFLDGQDPEKMVPRLVYPHSGVKGTGAYVPSTIVGIDDPGEIPVWFSDNGLVAGLPGGGILPFTEKQLAVSKYDSGAALYRKEDGIRSLVTSLVNNQNTDHLASTDSVAFEVRRNGIPIPPT